MRAQQNGRRLLFAIAVLALAATSACVDEPIFDDEPEDNEPRFDDPFPHEEPHFDGPEVFRPDFQPTTPVAKDMPPALNGGTLAIASDGVTALVADPARDLVYVVDTEAGLVEATIALREGDEPGRITVDQGGFAYVALRRGGAVLRFAVDAPEATAQRIEVCPSPTGIDYQERTDRVLVGCIDGRIYALSTNGTVIRSALVEKDIRDITVDINGDIYVTRMRAAEVLILSDNLTLLERHSLPDTTGLNFETGEERGFTAAVAWNTEAAPDGGVIVTHQRGTKDEVRIEGEGGYGGDPCGGGILHTAITPVKRGTTPVPTPSLALASLPVDLALAPGGNRLAIIAAGNSMRESGNFMPQVLLSHRDTLTREISHADDCGEFPEMVEARDAQPVAAAYTADGRLIVQSREPARLLISEPGDFSAGHWETTLSLSDVSVENTGWDIFHTATQGGLACASCHPGGADDGRVWDFQNIGPRSTQLLHGGIMDTAPFHWDGDMETLDVLMTEVFGGRMLGARLNDQQVTALAEWIDTMEAPEWESLEDPLAVERGKALFNSLDVQCVNCHVGDVLTDNRTVDVGTGKAFQVPTLVGLANRENYMHDGCAKTLHERFTNTDCGGGDAHGFTSQLTAGQIDDLVAYLDTL